MKDDKTVDYNDGKKDAARIAVLGRGRSIYLQLSFLRIIEFQASQSVQSDRPCQWGH